MLRIRDKDVSIVVSIMFLYVVFSFLRILWK